MVSISGCDPLDPGSNPGTAKTFCSLHAQRKSAAIFWVCSVSRTIIFTLFSGTWAGGHTAEGCQKKNAFSGNRTHAFKEDYDLNVAP